MSDNLLISVSDSGYYLLDVFGVPCSKTSKNGSVVYTFPPDCAVFLFFRYQNARIATLIRNTAGNYHFIGFSRKVKALFSVNASRVDKLKLAVDCLNKYCNGAYRFSDDQYLRLYAVLKHPGKLNIPALSSLFKNNIPY